MSTRLSQYAETQLESFKSDFSMLFSWLALVIFGLPAIVLLLTQEVALATLVLSVEMVVFLIFTKTINLNFTKKGRKIKENNEIDFALSQKLAQGLVYLQNNHWHKLQPDFAGAVTYNNLRIGEVFRQFDSTTAGSISGWLEHDLSFSGGFFGVSVGKVGVGIGSLGLGGSSAVNLHFSSRSRKDLLGEGFVAVFDLSQGRGNTVRLVVPSESATREFVGQFLSALADSYPKYSHSFSAIDSKIGTMVQSFKLSTSHVSDRLSSVLRMEAAERPKIGFRGVELSENIILGDSIWFEGDKQGYSLFPVGFLQNLTLLVLNDGLLQVT